MVANHVCHYCGCEFVVKESYCPHCGRPGIYGNVIAAEQADEREQLEERYQLARSQAVDGNFVDVFDDYENTVRESRAILARPIGEASRLAESSKNLYTTYYKSTESELRQPEGDKWDLKRTQADAALFLNFSNEIRHYALSLNETGVRHYGDCHLLLKSDMVAHRSTVLEENSALFVEKNISHIDELPKGYRATWTDRAKLAATKAIGILASKPESEEFHSVLLTDGAEPEKDDFIEVNSWGPISILSVETITVLPLKKGQKGVGRVKIKELEAHCKKYGVSVKVLQ